MNRSPFAYQTKQDAVWSDGVPINADDFVASRPGDSATSFAWFDANPPGLKTSGSRPGS